MSKMLNERKGGSGKMTLIFGMMVFVLIAQLEYGECCSSRTLPKPRPTTSSSIVSKPVLAIKTTPTAASTTTTTTTTTTMATTTSTTPRPNTTFPIYKCPAIYDAWYCLNEATCFSVKIGESIMYNCECAIGFMGPRCEYKELDGSLLPKRPRPMLEMASIASGATCALLFVFFVCLTLFLRYDQRSTTNGKLMDEQSNAGTCRFCNDKQCSDNYDAAKYRGNNSNLQWQQHIETIPMSFAIKRTTKL